MPDLLVDGEILLYGAVGESWWGDYFTPGDVAHALAEHGRANDVTVRINSGGGIASDGVAIFNALKAHRGAVSVIVEGIAASAASVIAMAGETVTMRTGSVMMIHDPATYTAGDVAEHERSIVYLNKVGDSMADIYAEKSGRPAEAIRDEMRAELWLTAAEAIEKGYADEEADEDAAEATAFAYQAYAHAPSPLVALADAKGWKLPDPKAARAAKPRRKDKTMATQPAAPPATTITPPAPPSADAAALAAASAETTARAAEIATLCANAGVPAMAAVLIREGVSLEAATARVNGAKDIRAAVDLARKSCPAIEATAADGYVAAGLTLAAVRADLFDKMTTLQSPEIAAQHQPDARPVAPAQAAATAGWDKALGKVRPKG